MHTLNCLNYFQRNLLICYFLKKGYGHRFKSINVLPHYHFVTQFRDFPLLHLINIVRLPINTFHFLLSMKKYINVYSDTEIILSSPTFPPSAHHNTKMVSVNLSVPVSQNFPLCIAHLLVITHILVHSC